MVESRASFSTPTGLNGYRIRRTDSILMPRKLYGTYPFSVRISWRHVAFRRLTSLTGSELKYVQGHGLYVICGLRALA